MIQKKKRVNCYKAKWCSIYKIKKESLVVLNFDGKIVEGTCKPLIIPNR